MRAVLGMRRWCPKSRLKRMWARQDYGARWRLQDSPIATFPDAARAGDLAYEAGQILRCLAGDPDFVNR